MPPNPRDRALAASPAATAHLAPTAAVLQPPRTQARRSTVAKAAGHHFVCPSPIISLIGKKILFSFNLDLYNGDLDRFVVSDSPLHSGQLP